MLIFFHWSIFDSVSYLFLQTSLYLQFQGETLFALIDRNGTSHPLPKLGYGKCNDNSDKMSNDIGRIVDRNWLPLRGFSYGPFKNARSSAYISAGVLMCKSSPEMSNQINLKQELIKNQDVIQNLEVC